VTPAERVTKTAGFIRGGEFLLLAERLSAYEERPHCIEIVTMDGLVLRSRTKKLPGL
jgi:hypothetical protein